MIPINILEEDRILIIAPHPDDECIGVGGLLKKCADRCSVIVMTDGCMGQGKQSTDSYRIQRHGEFVKEMKYWGIGDYQFLDILDGTLMSHLDCLEDIPLKKYTKIFVTGLSDGHSDHAAAYRCVKNALKVQENAETEVYLYEVHKELQNPSHFLDITECIESKLNAIRFHDSQLCSVPYDRLAEVMAEHRGIQSRQPNRLLEVYQKVDITNQDASDEEIEKERELLKFKQFYQILTKWILNDDVSDFQNLLINKMGISKCIIYGYAELGQILEKKLIEASIQIERIWDKKCLGISNYEIPICKPEDNCNCNIPIVVTATYYYANIKAELQKLGYKHIYSLLEVVSNL